MKKIILILSLICTSALWCNAQSNTVVAGGEATGNGGSASFTAGEVFYTSKSGNGLSTTDGVQQGIGANPTAVISGTNSICNGSTASLSIAFTGVGPWSGTLSDGTPFTTSNNPYTINVSPSSSTTYTVASLTDQNGTAVAGDLTGSATITVNAVNTNTTAIIACVTYTWPTSGVAYTQSGSYTLTSGCNTEILNLTINDAPTLPTLACYETASFNTLTCSWDVTGVQPTQPALACYETATFNNSTCSWDVTGSQPSMPSLTCYETASFNSSTCVWDVTGSQPAEPSLACYQTASFNTTTCNWDVTGSQPSQPALACYQTASFNTTTCNWDVTGSQPSAPTGLACYQTANFNTQSCSWIVTGSPAPGILTTATECDSYVWLVNGQTYTQSGIYKIFVNCQDYKLVLTINTSTTYYADVDNDGYGNAGSTTTSCNGAPTGYVSLAGDCNDNNSSTYPGATEVCGNGIDDNCDGQIDEGCVCVNPPTANAGANTNVCTGSSVTLNGSIGGSASNGTWSTSGTGTFSPSASVLNATYIPSSVDYTAGNVTLTLTTNAVAPCTAASSSVVITFTPLPAATGAITGQANLCQPGLNPYFYSVAPVAGASSYLWTIPTGTAFVGDSTTSTVLIKYIDSFVQSGIAGNITVTPINSTGCGSTSSSSLFVQAQIAAPVQPPSISGPQSVCNGDIATYSIANVARATSYIWTMPTGAIVIGGAGTNIITVSYGSTFTGGNITVASSNGCGTSAVRSRSVSRNVLGAPTSIVGAIDGLCSSSNVVYSISPVTGATSYLWTVPSGASITGSSTNNSIAVNFSSTFTTGNITAAAVNGCGTGTARSLAVKAVPGQPVSITGATAVCTLSSQTYSTQTVTGASSYVWTIPGGGTITSGQGSKIINMTYGATPSANGIVTVKASNTCGISAVRVLAVVSTTCPRVGDATSLSMVAYPNPANSILIVEFTAEQSQSVNMTMRDAAGRVVYNESKSTTIGVNSTTIDVSTFSKGVYLLQMQSDTNSELLRVLVE